MENWLVARFAAVFCRKTFFGGDNRLAENVGQLLAFIDQRRNFLFRKQFRFDDKAQPPARIPNSSTRNWPFWKLFAASSPRPSCVSAWKKNFRNSTRCSTATFRNALSNCAQSVIKWKFFLTPSRTTHARRWRSTNDSRRSFRSDTGPRRAPIITAKT